MISVAVRMLLHNPSRSLATVVGVGFAFFLITAQFGLMVGWCDTNSAIIRHSDVDVWIMARNTPAFDYGSGIPRHRIQQVRTIPGVVWAQGMFITWNFWQCPDGRRVTVEIVGLDEDCVGAPWEMISGTREVIQNPETVIIDDLYRKALGVDQIGDEVEILGKRAVVGGLSKNVRTFTAAPFVFATLDSAIAYDGRTDSSEITYVLARGDGNCSPEEIRDAVMTGVPGIEALTTSEFAIRTVRYWMLETGVGVTVVITALLGLVIGTFIISQTLYTITNEHINDYATLLAIGVGRVLLVKVIGNRSHRESIRKDPLEGQGVTSSENR